MLIVVITIIVVIFANDPTANDPTEATETFGHVFGSSSATDTPEISAYRRFKAKKSLATEAAAQTDTPEIMGSVPGFGLSSMPGFGLKHGSGSPRARNHGQALNRHQRASPQ